jgi:hypothetical protein
LVSLSNLALGLFRIHNFVLCPYARTANLVLVLLQLLPLTLLLPFHAQTLVVGSNSVILLLPLPLLDALSLNSGILNGPLPL